MEMNSKSLGDISEAMIVAAFLRAGVPVLRPVGDNLRYDLVIELDGVFKRVQCKTAQYKDGGLAFATCSSYNHRNRPRRNYRGEADLFAVYAPHTDKVYVIPVDEVGVDECRLRVDPLRQSRRTTRWAKDYEIGPLPVTGLSFPELRALKTTMPAVVSPACSECDARITKFSRSGLCNRCCRKTKHKWPDDETLKQMVLDANCLKVSKELGIPNSTVRKRLKTRNIGV